MRKLENFRLSEEARAILRLIAKKRGHSKTAVVESELRASSKREHLTAAQIIENAQAEENQ